MPITAEPTIVGMSYSEFAKKYGEDKAKAALQRIYGTTDPVKATEMQQQRTQQILSQQSQQKPPQAPSGPASPAVLLQPGQLSPGYSIVTGQPVTQPTQLKTPNVVQNPYVQNAIQKGLTTPSPYLQKTEEVLQTQLSNKQISQQTSQASQLQTKEQTQAIQATQSQLPTSPPYSTLDSKLLNTIQKEREIIQARGALIGQRTVEPQKLEIAKQPTPSEVREMRIGAGLGLGIVSTLPVVGPIVSYGSLAAFGLQTGWKIGEAISTKSIEPLKEYGKEMISPESLEFAGAALLGGVTAASLRTPTTIRVKVEPSKTDVIGETTKGESVATTKGKITVEKAATYGEGKEAVKTVGEYEYKALSQGVKQGKDVVGTHVIELVDKKTGAVEYYHAQGKASEISSAIKEIMQQQAEGKEISVYQGKQLFVTKQTMYKPQAELVMQPSTLEKPYPEIGVRYTTEKTQSKALGSYEFLRSLEQPGVEHPYKPYEVLGQEVGRVGAISKQKVGGTTVEFAQKGSVEAALIRGKPIEEPRGFVPQDILGKTSSVHAEVRPDVAEGIKYVFGESRVGYNYEPFSYVEKTTPELKTVATKPPTPEPIKTQPTYWGEMTVLKDISTKPQTKPVPTAELSVMQQSLIKDIAAMKAPAPTTTKTNIPIVPITTQTQEKPEKVGVNIESANQAYFSKIGTSYVKETLLNEEEQKARVVTVGPKVTEEQVQTYLTKQIEAEKSVKETTANQDVLAPIKIKEGIEEKTKKVLGMKAEQSINLEEKMVQKLTEKQIQRQMLKQKVIQPTVPTRVFPTAIPAKVVPYIPRLKSLFGEGGGRKQRTRQAIQSWLKKRPITEPKDVFKALKKVKFI